MATTKSNFVKMAAAALIGAAVKAAGGIAAFAADSAAQIERDGGGTRIDVVGSNLATAGCAKNGAASVALSGTTAKTIDLTALGSVTDFSAGDASFASVTQIAIRNTGSGSVTVAPGGSNPWDFSLGGTTPTLTIPAGGAVVLIFATPKVVDSTHKTLLFTPAADTELTIAVGGA